jgi:hypothetical protein
MSLNQFLAVGRSVVGIRGEKSPFEMKKECLLPIFEAAPRFGGSAHQPSPLPSEGRGESGQAPVQTDWLAPKVAPSPVPPPVAARPPSAPRRSILSVLTFGLWRKRGSARPLVQAELSLETVRVLRNDLSDSDLELVVKARPRARKASAAARSWSTLEEQQSWSRLASRWFEIKQR